MRIEDHSKELNTSIIQNGRRELAEGAQENSADVLVHEHFLAVELNGYPAAELSCTADHLPELVLGRLCTEGIIEGTDQVERIFICGKGNLAEVTLAEGVALSEAGKREPTCCTGNRQFLGGARTGKLQRLPEVCVEREAVFAMAIHFKKDSALHRSTNGTHSCYLHLPDGEIAGFEDISRHNALDKAVGHMLMRGADPQECMLYTTGRVPADMVQKAVMARVPVLVSKSVPTDAAVQMAAEYGLQLYCKAWPDSFTVY
ncbi:MAG: formate dehydrogenase accessory sulfurtransferase FdhD [Lachnospiraceae bacterium]|nr:formate dehydrogenase accessory sulfurtransferase FdhD [Lachnospiraceae bacterium]